MFSDKMSKPATRSLRALDLLYFVLSDVRGGLKPFLAVYLAAAHHWDPGRIGIAMGVMGLAELAAQTPCGALTDAARDKRGVIVLAFLLVGAGSMTMVVWPAASVILLSQALIGAAGSVFGPAMAAVSLGLVGHEGLARRMGRNQALDHSGNLAAAALAGWVGDTIGYGGIFVVSACMCLAGALATILIRRSDVDATRARGCEVETVEPEKATPKARTAHVAGVTQLLADRRMTAFAASVVLFHFANAAMLPLVGQKLAAGAGTDSRAASSMASAIIAAQLVMIPVALAASRLAETWGRKPVFLIGFLVLPVRGLLYTMGVDATYLVAVQLLDGIGAGIFGVVGVLVIADLTRGTGRFSFMQGALATATGLGAALSNVVTGAVVQSAGFDAGFLVLAMIAAVALFYFALAVPETRPLSAAIFPGSAAASFSAH